jgi:tetratricopeptide (TPR) repeat protein
MNLELDIIREGKKFRVEATSPLGKGSGAFELDSSVYSQLDIIQEVIEDVRSLDKGFAETFGALLFEYLFSTIKDLVHTCLNQSDHLDIILNMSDETLDVLPWELAYDKGSHTFLGADPHCSITRRDQKSTKTFPKIDYPLKVLIIVSSPMDLDERGEYQPDPDEIKSLMEPLKGLEEKGMVKVDFLDRASVKHIQDKLREGYHIVHFIGHGNYDPEKGTGSLTIEDNDRNLKKLSGPEVARLFGVSPPQLLILTACESAPLIPSLLTRNIPAVLAMQYSVLKDIAHQFVERFYSSLVRGDTVSGAVSNARNAVSLEKGTVNPGWFTPVLYMRSPHILKINTASIPTPFEKPVVKRFDSDKDLIGVETFVGRRKDLWLVEKALFEENLKCVLIKGIGGIGKSSLASKFVRRHKYSCRAVFARKMVDPSMGVEEILMMLDQFLQLNNDNRLHDVIGEPDLDYKLEVLNHCLKKGYILVLDNFEVLLEDSHIKDKDIEELVKAITFGDHLTKVIITSRYGFTFADEKAGGLIRVVDVDELSFQFAGKLLEKLGITDVRVQVEVYKKIGGNPQFLEFFAKLSETRPTGKLLEDITPVREKIGEWLMNELVSQLINEEQHILKEVSVFRLPMDRDVFDVLKVPDTVVDHLVDYSLIKFEKDKYGYYMMHPAVRDYVYALLSDDERVRAHSDAASYYTMLIEKKKADILDIIELHYHLVEAGQYEKAGDLAVDLSEPFLRWGYWKKLMELLMQTVATTSGKTKAAGMHNLAAVLQKIGNYKEAEEYYTQSLKLLEELGDKHGIASSLHQLGVLQQYQGNYKEAEKYYTQSLKLKEELGDKHGIAQSLHQLGMLQEYQGNYKEAEEYYTQSLKLEEELGDKHGIAVSLGQLGRLSERREDYKEAVEYYIVALSLFSELGSPDAETAIKSLKRVRKTIGGGQFDNYWKALTDQEVPDFIKHDRELEEFIQYILYIVETNNQEEIEKTKKTITELLEGSEPDITQFLQLLLDILSRKDISQKIKELKEPFKSALEKYMEDTNQ